jgi:hypothetical protein
VGYARQFIRSSVNKTLLVGEIEEYAMAPARGSCESLKQIGKCGISHPKLKATDPYMFVPSEMNETISTELEAVVKVGSEAYGNL